MKILDRLISKLFGSQKIENHLRKFFANLSPVDGSAGKILQYVGISSMFLSPLEILLYHLLRQKGFDIDYLIYDQTVPINEVITEKREQNIGKEKFWVKSCADGERNLRAAGVDFEYIPMDQRAVSTAHRLPDLDSILQYRLDGIEFGKIVESTLYRYFKSLTFGESAEPVARRMLTTALANYYCVQKKCKENDYRYIMFSHGIYITWQPVVEYCRLNQINFICYDRAKTRNHGNFNVNQPSPDWSFNAAWKRYSDRKLTGVEKEQVRRYLHDRELQKGDVYAYNFSERASDLTELKARLGIPLNRKCITIFTNLIWDAANVSRDIAFSSALECITKTIEHYRNRDDVQVIVRTHPAEQVLGTNDRYRNLIHTHFDKQIPQNVTIISPEDDINSFTVIDLSDVGVVNTSTVGLEMAMLGKLVLLISETHYRGKGFTIDVENPADYFFQLDRALANPLLPESRRELAEKYFFMMMFLYQMHFPIRYRNQTFLGYTCDHLSELPVSEPVVRIIDQLARGDKDDFVVWPVANEQLLAT